MSDCLSQNNLTCFGYVITMQKSCVFTMLELIHIFSQYGILQSQTVALLLSLSSACSPLQNSITCSSLHFILL